jgi:tetratricopeptide (TPR) repeat protein
MCFGIILGWVIAVQQRPEQPAAPAASTTAAGAEQPPARQAPPLNQAAVDAQLLIFKNDPKNAGAALQLGNLYFDAERYADAIKWYEESLSLDPKNPDASTDLGISYYYSGQTDRALKQFENSLSIDPQHTKTMLNQGIVLAFGKQDLAAAEAAWKKLVAISPDSPEGQAAKRALDGIAAAGHSTSAVGS